MDTQEIKEHKLKRFAKETMRVLRITKKPNKEEYKSIVKITALGIAVIGLIGFIIFLGKQLCFNMSTQIYGLRTAANREDQVVDYLISKLQRRPDLGILAVIVLARHEGLYFHRDNFKRRSGSCITGSSIRPRLCRRMKSLIRRLNICWSRSKWR